MARFKLLLVVLALGALCTTTSAPAATHENLMKAVRSNKAQQVEEMLLTGLDSNQVTEEGTSLRKMDIPHYKQL